jgi:membrane-anchored mycosin MYCP
VVVMSLGCFTRDGLPPLVLKTAVDMVRDDVVLLAAGGNYADMRMREIRTTGITRRTPMWPAALDGVTAVGSHDAAGRRSAFSPCVPWIDLTAPGERLSSTYLDGLVDVPAGQGSSAVEFKGYATWSGSSMSTAVAAGRLAVLRDGDEPLRRTLARLVASGDAPYVRDVDA